MDKIQNINFKINLKLNHKLLLKMGMKLLAKIMKTKVIINLKKIKIYLKQSLNLYKALD